LPAAGASVVVGIDLIPGARDTALRDRPGAAEYVAGHVGEPGPVARLGLEGMHCERFVHRRA